MQMFGSIEIARMIQASPSSVQRWIDKKLIPSFRTPGGHRRVSGRDLLHFLALRGMEPVATPCRADVIGVENEELTLALLKQFTAQRRPDLNWLGVSTGFEAGIEVIRHRPSLVFLEIELPGVHGCDVCRTIKLSPELEKTRVVIITGHMATTIAEKARAAGADDVLTKPISVAAVESHLALVPKPLGRLVNA